MRRGQIWLDRQQMIEHIPLMVRKLTMESPRIEQRPSLLWRHLPHIAEGLANKPAAVRRQTAEPQDCATNILPLLRRQTFHGFNAVQITLTLLRWHGIELAQALAHPVLHGWWKPVESRLF